MRGRTGLAGRGVLGKYVQGIARFAKSDLFSHRWGPNHAADPIVTRWQREEGGQVVSDTKTGKQVDTFRWSCSSGNVDTFQVQVLEFVAIQRKDTGAWAIPGGMVDPGEKVLLLMVNFQ